MTVEAASKSPASRVDLTLHLLQALGLCGVIGGLAALVAMWAFSPLPATENEWRLLVGAMRSVFYCCVFTGIVILVPVGVILWWRRRAALRGQGWFRALMIILVLTIPGLHIGARLTSIALRRAVDEGDVARAGELWDRLGWLFVAGFVVMLVAAFIATAKPRLGQSDGIQ